MLESEFSGQFYFFMMFGIWVSFGRNFTLGPYEGEISENGGSYGGSDLYLDSKNFGQFTIFDLLGLKTSNCEKFGLGPYEGQKGQNGAH